MMFDAATPTVAPVEIDPASGTTRIGTAIGANTVAYIDLGPEKSGELVIHHLASNVSQRMTNDTSIDENPAVSPDGNVVVWQHCPTSASDCDIWQAVKSGGAWTTSIVADSPGWQQSYPSTNGSLVAYASTLTGSTQDIVWRPVAGGAEVHLELPGYAVSPKFAGDFISFESYSSLGRAGAAYRCADVVSLESNAMPFDRAGEHVRARRRGQ